LSKGPAMKIMVGLGCASSVISVLRLLTRARWDEPPRIGRYTALRGYIYATKEHNGQVTIRSAHCGY
jgi:hypothetical protein